MNLEAVHARGDVREGVVANDAVERHDVRGGTCRVPARSEGAHACAENEVRVVGGRRTKNADFAGCNFTVVLVADIKPAAAIEDRTVRFHAASVDLETIFKYEADFGLSRDVFFTFEAKTACEEIAALHGKIVDGFA